MCSPADLWVRWEGVGQEEDSLAQSLLEEGQDVGQHGLDIVPTEVHQLAEQLQLLTAGLKLGQLQESSRMGGHCKGVIQLQTPQVLFYKRYYTVTESSLQ